MRSHQDWSSPGWSLAPVAPVTGPFPHRPFLKAAAETVSRGEPLFVENEEGFLALARWDDQVEMLGAPDFTDYHSPLGPGVIDLVSELRLSLGGRWRLDSLPAEAAAVICKGLDAAGEGAEPVQHELAMVLELPRSFDDYLERLGKKERHELRRKVRRFELAVGEVRLESHSTPNEQVLTEFVRLHRLSAGAKGGFLTPAVETLFRSLSEQPGWQVELLRGPDGPAVAAAFAYQDGMGYYLYNSGYDPTVAQASPGLVLLASLIERSIENSLQYFDFLKGDEDYKARLGARPRPLYSVEVG
ncbi:MAG TPA: GNAT family N-acetyltransferase [Acidimicrobiia bacterium]|nr:GNAT family N-acetyltransferase [Acidimicrobiia bacterium]